MFTALLSVTLLTPSAPVPKDFKATGPAPYPLTLTPDPDGTVRVILRGTPAVRWYYTYGRSARYPLLDELADLRVTTADGKAVSLREAAKLIAAGTSAVASADGKRVDPAHLRVLKPGTLVLVSPDLANRKVEAVPQVTEEPLIEVETTVLFKE